ncbi:MAG TPA: low molecular weight phosphatase family protein [Actinomycetota bacterium]|nr:low molecular weight phosphatase family protein [Actinomycetota bacterium]
MTSILVVCTGNICRSPIAEGLLRDALAARFGAEAPSVSSAGMWGVEGSSATPEAVAAAAERGADIRTHIARRVSAMPPIDDDLVVCMAREHRDALADTDGRLRDRVFTLKELVRLLESLAPVGDGAGPGSLPGRVAEAAEVRDDGFAGNPHDEDVADPLGLAMQSYRAIAWELDEWIERLVDGLYGPVAVRAASEG